MYAVERLLKGHEGDFRVKSWKAQQSRCKRWRFADVSHDRNRGPWFVGYVMVAQVIAISRHKRRP